jgi:hypothetical protein
VTDQQATDRLTRGPTAEDITDYITPTYPETIVGEAMNASFFSLDESHWPNFATIVTTDEHPVWAISTSQSKRPAYDPQRRRYERRTGTYVGPTGHS